MSKPKSLFLKCACHTHAFELKKYDDENDIWITFWHSGFYNHNTLWERIKFAWHILCSGRIAVDDFTINKDDCERLIKYLEEIYR